LKNCNHFFIYFAFRYEVKENNASGCFCCVFSESHTQASSWFVLYDRQSIFGIARKKQESYHLRCLVEQSKKEKIVFLL